MEEKPDFAAAAAQPPQVGDEVQEAARLTAWSEHEGLDMGWVPKQPPSDAEYPITERFPRQLLIEVTDDHTDLALPQARMHLREATPNPFQKYGLQRYNPFKHDGRIKNYRGRTGSRQGFTLGPLGDPLDDRAFPRDNTPTPETRQAIDQQKAALLARLGLDVANAPEALGVDGYRFHDALHLSFMALTNYSAVIRNLLQLRRWSDPQVARIEDGPRAVLQEESMFNKLGMLKSYTTGLIMPDTYLQMGALSEQYFLDKVLQPGTFIGLREWEKAVKVGTRLFCLLANTIGQKQPGDADPQVPDKQKIHSAFIYLDLDRKSVHFSRESALAAKSAAAIGPHSPLFYGPFSPSGAA